MTRLRRNCSGYTVVEATVCCLALCVVAFFYYVYPVIDLAEKLSSPAEITAANLANAEKYLGRTLAAPINPGLYRAQTSKGSASAIADIFLSKTGQYSVTLVVKKGSVDIFHRTGSGEWTQKGATLTFFPGREELQGFVFGTYGVDQKRDGMILTNGSEDGMFDLKSVGVQP